jgi:hypothetical protein
VRSCNLRKNSQIADLVLESEFSGNILMVHASYQQQFAE